MPDEKTCGNCGATFPADSLFCERCGQPLGGAPQEPAPRESVTRPYEPTRAPAPVPPPSRPQRRTDPRFLLSLIGTAVAVILLLATVVGPGLSSITGPHAATDNSPSGSPSVIANPSKSSPTPTLNPKTADYSSYFNKGFARGSWVMVQPFAKSTNNRGNDVYQGIIKNATSGFQYKMVIELMPSQTDAKQLYDQMVAQKIKEGFVNQPDRVALEKGAYPYTEVWVGQREEQYFSFFYYYDSGVSSWLVRTNIVGS